MVEEEERMTTKKEISEEEPRRFLTQVVIKKGNQIGFLFLCP